MYEFAYEISPAQMESAYRHLHHADALRFLERGRLDLLTQLGHANDQLISQDLLLVITNISINYRRELFAGPVFVQCHSLRVDGRDLVIEQRLLNERKKLAVEATVISCFMSGITRRAILPPEAFARDFAAR